ncbi:MAG: LuxR C-terminal-related transcriptional regulator, partial [Bacteroidota bacterium]|nr:LuxR C-terminal-related transcriptional regulator [Bacteroidota bacterium]
LLNFSVEFFKSKRPEMETWFEKLTDYLKPVLETGKPDLSEVRFVYDFYRVHREWLMQDKIEQQLLKKLVLQMEDGIILTVQKQKKPFLRSNYVPIESDEMEEPVQLTEREKEVLTYVALGFLNKEIAAQLNIGLTTVITHRKKLIEKLGIKTVSGLTVYAHTHGYID